MEGPRHTRDEQLELLGELTAMLTLALDDDRPGLDAYLASLPADVEHLRDLLAGAVDLYAHAFTRAGAVEGFDPVMLNRSIALREAQERWQLAAPE